MGGIELAIWQNCMIESDIPISNDDTAELARLAQCQFSAETLRICLTARATQIVRQINTTTEQDSVSNIFDPKSLPC